MKPKMRDVLEKMRECGKDVKMRDFPHDCGMVDTYGLPLLLQSFKHDAILDAESEIGTLTMLVSFWVLCGLTKTLSGYHKILTNKKRKTAPQRQLRILMWPETIIFFVARKDYALVNCDWELIFCPHWEQ